MRLDDLLKSPEGKTLEFKRDASSPNGLLRSLVAFCNTAGGIVVIGIDDGSATVRGVNQPLELEERIANLVSDNIVPRVLPDIEILPWRNTQVLTVKVYPSSSRPHHLKREGSELGTYVRVGSTNRRADRQLIEELTRFSRGESYDGSPAPDFDVEAIDFQAACEAFAPIRKLRRTDLETLRMVTTHQGRKVPTTGGLLLFGKTRELHFPDAWIQVGRFRGTDKANIIDHAEIRSYPAFAILEAVAFVEKHSEHGFSIDKARRTEHWTLPPVAVREAIVNAVVHADYAQRGAPIRISIFDDRLEVENPGLLVFGLTIDDLRQGISKLRNHVLGRVFNELGFVEQWGSGIQRIIASCRDAGLDSPALAEYGNRFRLTLYNARKRPVVLDAIDQAIINALADGEALATKTLSVVSRLTTRATRSRLAKLVGTGLIREIGSGPQDPHRRYILTGEPGRNFTKKQL